MERKKVILAVSSDVFHDQRVCKIAKSLQDFSFEVVVIGRKMGECHIKMSFMVHLISTLFNKNTLFYLEYNFRLFWRILKHKPNLIVANDADTLVACTLAHWILRVPFLYDAHEIFTEVPELANKKIKKFLWSVVEKIGIWASSDRYTVNASLAGYLQQKYNASFKVVQNVPYLDNSYQKIETKRLFLLYQGALNEGRGLELLLQCIPKLNIPLKIAGKGPLETKLKELSKQLLIEDKVHFLGNVLPHDLSDLSKKAIIGFNLLEANSLNYYYSLANKFFDYMHAQTPQISMNFIEYKRINNLYKVALLIDDLNKQNLLMLINKLLTQKDLYENIQKQTIEAKQVYCWQNEEKILYEIYTPYQSQGKK